MYIHKLEKDSYCPTEYAANIFAGKWKPRIICLLSLKEPLRYKEIKKLTPGITDQVLSAALKELESAGIVSRRQYDEMPVRVEYSLTKAGKELVPVLRKICRWAAETYGRQVMGTAETCPFVRLAKGKSVGL